MGGFDINQMKQALIRQGIPKYRVDFMSDAQVQKLCNERLHESLTGNQNWNNNDQFLKQLSYNSEYTLPTGEKIKVASVATQTLQSGTTVQVFVDYAGNQYFSYEDSKGKPIDENTFNAQEKMQWGDKLNYQDGILYAKSLVGVLKPMPQRVQVPMKPAHSVTPQQTPGSKYHPKYKDLEIDKNGKIDKSQFTPAKIKSKYSDTSKYIIDDYKNTQIREVGVYDRNTKELIVRCKSLGNGEYLYETLHNTNNDRQIYSYDINSSGMVSGYSISSEKGGVTNYTYESDGKTLKSVVKDDGKGKRSTDLYEKNVHTSTIKTNYNPATNEPISKLYILYRNGKPYYEQDLINKTQKFYAVDKLCKIAKEWVFSSFDSSRANHVVELLDSIDPQHKQFIVEQFEEKMGYPFSRFLDTLHYDDGTLLKIGASINFSSGTGADFIDIINSDTKIYSGQVLAQHLSYMNKDNIMNILPYISGLDIGRMFTNKDKMDQVIHRLMDISYSIKDDKNYGYTKDCIADFVKILNKPHPSKYDLDKYAMRLKNRIEGGNRAYTFNLASDKDIPNGKLDKNFKQSTTGDCWLLAGIISIQNNPIALEKVNDLITVNQDTGDVTVNLKGVGKKIVVKKEELNVSTHLSQGDADIRAVEVAVDKYIKTYDLNYNDINGNNATYLWGLLFGNNKTRLITSSLDFIRNQKKPDKIFALAIGRDFNPKDLIIEKMDGTRVDTITNHEYSIVSSDTNYVYLKNPHDSAELLRSPLANFMSRLSDDQNLTVMESVV